MSLSSENAELEKANYDAWRLDNDMEDDGEDGPITSCDIARIFADIFAPCIKPKE